MDNVEISPHFKATSISVPSPTASHVASLAGSKLNVRCLTTFQPTRVISLPNSFDNKNPRFAWSPPTSAPIEQSTTSTPPRRTSHRNRLHSNRILVADDDTTRVYDLRDDKWSAVISNGSGGMGKNIHVEFGATEEEVLVWSDFAACLKIWCLRSGRAVEVRDPKFSGRDGRGWGFRPRPLDTERAGRGDVLALLCRSSGLDVLVLLAAGSYNLLSRVELPTVDAVGVKWSLDGRWLAVWDAASTGFKMHIYTADGHLYRTITKEPSEETDAWGIEGLGIKTVEWIPGNEKLAIGGWDKRIRILSTRTFAPLVFLDHTPVINVPSAPVYTEHVDGQGNRSYAITPQPFTPPKAPTEKNDTGLMKTGIGMMAFNFDGTLCATRDDSSPSTVWVWDLKSLKPRCIFVQYAPVKSLLWHPSDAGKLLVHTTLDKGVIYAYSTASLSSSSSSSTSQESPAIIDLSAHIPKPTSSAPVVTKWHTSWLMTQPDKKPLLLLGNQAGSVLVWPEGKDQILRFEHEEESDDSLYEILTGKKSVPRVLDVEMDLARDDGSLDASVGLDDTFREKRGRGFENQGLGESGLDEMF